MSHLEELLSKNRFEEFFEVFNQIENEHLQCEWLVTFLTILNSKDFTKEISNVLIRILQKWSPTEDRDTTIAEIAGNSYVHENLLRFIAVCTKNLSTPISILSSVLTSEQSDLLCFPIVVVRLLKAYQVEKITETQWLELEEIIQTEQANDKEFPPETLSYITYQKNSSKPSIPKPEWISVKEGETIDMINIEYWNDKVGKRAKVDDLEIDVINNLKKIARITEPEEEEKQVPQIIEVVKRFLSVAKDSEIQALHDTGLTRHVSTTVETQLDRIWGPINAIIDKNCPTAPGNIGPCRMLSCQCREYDDDEENYFDKVEIMEWWDFYDHRCKICVSLIDNPSYALRYPVTGGGWLGCYCSFECMKEEPPRNIGEEDALVLELIQGTILTNGICDWAELKAI